MAASCPVVTSDTASLPEVCGGAVLHFDPPIRAPRWCTSSKPWARGRVNSRMKITPQNSSTLIGNEVARAGDAQSRGTCPGYFTLGVRRRRSIH